MVFPLQWFLLLQDTVLQVRAITHVNQLWIQKTAMTSVRMVSQLVLSNIWVDDCCGICTSELGNTIFLKKKKKSVRLGMVRCFNQTRGPVLKSQSPHNPKSSYLNWKHFNIYWMLYILSILVNDYNLTAVLMVLWEIRHPCVICKEIEVQNLIIWQRLYSC